MTIYSQSPDTQKMYLKNQYIQPHIHVRYEMHSTLPECIFAGAIVSEVHTCLHIVYVCF